MLTDHADMQTLLAGLWKVSSWLHPSFGIRICTKILYLFNCAIPLNEDSVITKHVRTVEVRLLHNPCMSIMH